MKFKSIGVRLIVLLSVLLVFSCVGKKQTPLFVGTQPRDPGLVQGVLPNGFQYLILENTTPKDRVSVHLNVFAGSIHETDEEQGVAHFLEHMLFNGSEHFKPGELITYFQSIGMDFGADANARTSFYNTIYDLSLPRGDQQHMKDAFVVVKDYAGGALLLQEEIDSERGVVLAEKRERDSVSYRTFKRELAFEMPESRLNHRLPIGTTQVLETIDRKILKGFYDHWYRPDNMALVVVGDMDARKTERLIRETFSTLTPRSDKEKVTPDISWTAHNREKVFYHYESEAGNTNVTIERLNHNRFKAETIETLKKRVTAHLGNLIFQNRLSRMVREQSADFTSASVYSGTHLRHVTMAAVQASCDAGRWEATLAQLEQSLRQALEHGFLAQELDRVKAELLSSLDSDVAGASTRKTSRLATSLLQTMNRKGLFLSPAQNREILKSHIESTSLEDVHTFFKKVWADDHRLVLVSGNASITDRPEARILETYSNSQKKIIHPFKLFESKAFPYLKVPEPSASILKKSDNVKNLGITQVDLSNNIRLNLKPTTFKKGKFSFKVTFGNGRAGAPTTLPGISRIAESTVRQSGFGAMDMDQLGNALAGKDVTMGFKIQDNYFAVQGSASPEEAELVFQLIYTYFTDPGFRPQSLALAKNRYRQEYQGLKRTPDGIMRVKGNRFLANGDPEFGLVEPDQADRISLEDIKSWLMPQFKSEAIEVSLVGDFDPQSMVDLGKAYLGAMDERNAPLPMKTTGRRISFPKGKKQVFTLDSKIDKGVVRVAFLTDDYWDIMQTRKLSMLTRVFSERLRMSVRETLGASYSPYVYNNPSLIHDHYGVLQAVINVSPGTEDLVYEQVEKIVKDLVDNGVTPKELDLVKKPLLTHLDVLRQNNDYWLKSVLANSLRHPERLEWANHLVSGYSGISPDDLTVIARQYLNIEDRALILIQPIEH